MKGKKIELIEISPRDGYQILKPFIPTEIKKDMSDRIADSGVRSIQVTSFVKAIEQMKDAPEIAAYCFGKYPHLNLSALAPNRFGARLAGKPGYKEINFVNCVSRRHNCKTQSAP
jgi:hydroxymethylglutaryl-CoA lyase